MPNLNGNPEHARMVREHSEKAVMKEMEDVPAEVPYTCLELVGKGSFGSVYKAIHNETKQLYAVKSLDLDQHEEDIKDIQKEIGLLSHLKAGDAPNITTYHGSYLLGQRLWVVMDFCSGGSLRTLMKAGPIEEKFISIVVRETLTALGFLHKNGIIHRDIKAANILVNQDGRVQLCDFGVSAQLTSKNGKRQTFIGTPQWMAPEALSGGLYDFRIDIWSFGITVIEMAKQNPPLHHILPERAIDMIPRLPPPRLEGGTWSNSLREFVAMCLNEIPEDRSTVEELQRTKFVKAARAPTTVMRELITRYEIWERGGGVRDSMLYGIGMMQDNDGYGDSVGEGGWDFDTIKSRASGVPKEWDMASRRLNNTVRPISRSPLRSGPRPLGAAQGLYKLFENPAEEDRLNEEQSGVVIPMPEPNNNGYKLNYSDFRQPPPEPPGGLNFISIPSFDDNGLPIMNNSHAPPPPPPSQPQLQPQFTPQPAMPTVCPPSPFSGQIFMPTEEEMIQMAKDKARVAALAAPPPTAPVPLEPNAKPITRMHRSDSTGGASVLRPVEIGGPPSPRRESSPRRMGMPIVPASAPSSPPRSASASAVPYSSAQTARHGPSRSVPNIRGRTTPDDTPPPPMPSLRGIPKVSPPTDTTPSPLHGKTRSHDATVRPRPPGRLPVHKPSNLNLGPPHMHSNFVSRQLPPSPGRTHTPQASVGSVNGMARMGVGVGMAQQKMAAEEAAAGAATGVLQFPRLGHLSSEALYGDHRLMAAELDRILTGMGDALEVMEVGLKKLSAERQKKTPVGVEEEDEE